ncbi:MAG: hypothetical protein NXH85_15340 [Pseudomonadaceae bacterium]|nr:hypothetical protein [Pseudomonadaceae bacterium]
MNNTINMIAVDWSKHRGKRSAYLSQLSSRTIEHMPFDGSLANLLDEVRRLPEPTLIGIDAAIGIPTPTWRALQTLTGSSPNNFVEFLNESPHNSTFFEPVATPDQWSALRPFIAPLKGPWSLTQFIERSNDGIHPRIDRQLNANSVFVTRGMPGTVGSGTRALWMELIELQEPTAFNIWPFDGTLEALITQGIPVIAEIYPKACYGICLSENLPTPLLGIPKTKRPARNDAISKLLKTDWVTRADIRIEGAARAIENEDDFDALMSCAALTRLVLEKRSLESADSTDCIVEGGVLGASSLTSGTLRLMRSRTKTTPPINEKQTAPSTTVYHCPIPGCTKVFHGSRGGWDAHVASARKHPAWHPTIKDPVERKARFRDAFSDWF